MRRLVCLFLLSVACVAPSQVTTYTAATDILVHNYSPLALPAANAPFTDPDFTHSLSGGFCRSSHTCMVRATDLSTAASLGQGQPPNVSFHTSSGAVFNQWSTDDTHFIVSTSQGNRPVLMNFNPQTGAVTVGGLLPKGVGYGTGQPDFSWTEPTKVYGYNGGKPQIIEYDIATNTLTTLYDMTKCPGLNATGTGGGVDSSYDVTNSGHDSRYATYVGPQNTAPVAVIYDRGTGKCRWYNTATDSIGGDVAFPGGGKTCTNCFGKKGVGIHGAEISHDGKFLGLTVNGIGVLVWQIETTSVLACSTCYSEGHRAQGYNEIVISPQKMNADWQLYADAAPNVVSSASAKLPPWLPCLNQSCRGVDHHPTWPTNSQQNSPVYAANFANANFAGGTLDPTQPGVGEVNATAMDGSQTTWRFCHVRTNTGLDNNLFWHTPRGNVTKDGKFFMFTTNWDGTLGFDNGGHYRDDVVICELR
jgi:hypothetical protein